ncbi:Lysine-specific demethylase 4C [Chamberlinius hualienensis]
MSNTKMSTGVGVMCAPKIMIFRPTMEEFKDFASYIDYMESKGAHKAGLAKVIPPKEWCPRKGGYDDIDNVVIPSPISQMVTGRQGLYQQLNIQKKAMTVKEFKTMAGSPKFKTPTHFDYEDLERKYWKNITYNSPIYGADVSGSLYDQDVDEWNINNLNTVLDYVSGDYGIKIDGVNTAYLYFGMWKTSFAWHTEDMDLYSINYLHFGAPKSWYVVPPEHGKRLERLASGFFPSNNQICQAFLRHKMTIISPPILKKFSIPYDKITQEPGEFMITFPYGYHAGYNHGFNCAESTNFASVRWIEYGKRATRCFCRNDCVKISMDTFVKRFQPDKYELWLAGKDVGAHPEDPNKLSVAAPPTKSELIVSKGDKRRRMEGSMVSKRNPVTKLENVEPEFELGQVEEQKVMETEAAPVVEEQVEEQPDSSNECVDDDEEEEADSDDDDDEDSDWSQHNDDKPYKPKRKKRKTSARRKKPNLQQSNVATNAVPVVQLTKLQTSSTSQPQAFNQTGAVPLVYQFGNSIFNPVSTENSQEIGVKAVAQVKHEPIAVMSQVHTEPNFLMSQVKTEPNVLMPPALSFILDASNFNQSAQNLCLRRESSDSAGMASKPQQELLKDSTIDKSKSEHAFVGVKNTAKSQSSGQLSKHNKRPKKSGSKKESNSKIVKVENDSRLLSLNDQAEVRKPPTLKPVKPLTTGYKNVENRPAEDLPPFLVAQVELSQNGSYNSMQKTSELTNANDECVKTEPVVTNETNNVSLQLTESSDDDSTNGFVIEDIMEEWAKPHADLWQHKKTNFAAEKVYNEKVSQSAPFCCICSFFKTPKKLYNKNNGSRPLASKVLIPEYAFYGTSTEPVTTPSLMNDDGTSALLVCAVCKICVHGSCYGVSKLPNSNERWYCCRCIRQDRSAECCLCRLRGGALKPMADGLWSHVGCALLLKEAYFDFPLVRDRVVAKIHTKLKCSFCHHLSRRCGRFNGGCVQCSVDNCGVAFHVTCAYAAGVRFEICPFPEIFKIACLKHCSNLDDDNNSTEIELGQKVISKHKNRRFYHCFVEEIRTNLYYSADFEDGSSCDNLLPSDIQSHNCLKDGPPDIDENIIVKWTDGENYDAVFRGTTTTKLYKVRFEDDSTNWLRRTDVFAEGEELPKKVKTKLSIATDMKHEDAFQVPADPFDPLKPRQSTKKRK